MSSITGDRTQQQTDAVIIGAGPAGLTAAYELVKHGRTPLVLEKDAHYVGGLARTVQHNGFRFDIGGHRFFSKSDEIERLWEEICGEDFLTRARRSRILYRGKLFDYPIRAGNVFRGLGPFESLLCVLSYLKACLAPLQPELSFEDWVVNRFGRRLFEIFFRTYTEKVWGMACAEISADWASQRIRGLSLKEAVVSALLPRRHSRSAKTVKTLIDTFRYPRLGPGMMWERARDRIVSAGGTVAMGRKVTRICHDGQRVTSLAVRDDQGREEIIHAAHVICSMPLRDLLERWQPAPPADVLRAARGLRYRDFMVVALYVRRADVFPDNWIYVHDPTVRVGRIQNFRAWSPDMVPDPGSSCLGLEYFCSEDDSLWAMSDPAVLSVATEELERLGLARKAEIENGCVVRVAQAYPVYDGLYRQCVGVIRQYLGQFSNLQVVGRNGMHKYNNQDHSMMTALLAARNVMGAHFDVWKVNTDAEYLEEAPDDSADARLMPLPTTPPLGQSVHEAGG